MNEGDDLNSGDRPRSNYIGSRRYHNSSNDSGTPEFFNDALAANTPVSQPQRSHKGLIIGIISVLAIALIVLILVFVLKNGGIGGIHNRAAVISKFNTYANYILFGEEKDSDIPEYEYTNYKIMDIYRSTNQEQIDAFVAKSNQLFKEFSEEYEKNEEIDKSYITYCDDYETTVYSLQSTVIPESFLIKSYIEHGKSSTNSYIKTYYGSYTDKDILANNQRAEASYALIDVLEKMSELACQKNGQIDMSCTEAAKNPELDELWGKYYQASAEAESTIEVSRANVIKNLWLIKDVINAKE